MLSQVLRHFSRSLSTSQVQKTTSTSNLWHVLQKIRLPKKTVAKSKTQVKKNANRPSHPTSVPLSKLFANQFPLPLKQLFEDYALRHNPLQFQHDVLATLPFFPEADKSGRQGKVVSTELLSGYRINEFAIYPGSFHGKLGAEQAELYQKSKHLIMIHGYGGGLGFWLKNFNEISQLDDWVVHSIDLLGYGCSSRPPFKIEEESIHGVDKWFHDSFQEWLKLRRLDEKPQNNLVLAHSMGAYLMGTYGIKVNPSFCNKMLMVSPGAIIKHRKQVPVPAYFARLWEQNISPFCLVRNTGPIGSKLVSMWSFRRFADLPKKEATLLHKYAYGIFQSPGSGEYMLNYLLAPGADARHPLIERGIHKLRCKLLWWYGEDDWMDKKGGQLCSNIINNVSGDPARSTVELIPNAGHHLYLDNSHYFNQKVLAEMRNMRGED